MTGPEPPDTRARTIAAAETWFVRHGLPYFVDSEREAVRRGLAPARIGPVVGVAALVGLAVGGMLGWLAGSVPVGVSAAVNVAGLVFALYALTTLRLAAIARWAAARTFRSLGLLFPLVTRALPLLLLFVTFLFINAEVWQVSAQLDGGVMWATVLLFAGIAVGFLLVRLPEELDRVDDEVSGDVLVRACQGTPLESAARSLAASRETVAQDAVVRGFQKVNLVLVLLVTQTVQVLLLSLSVFAFFILFGVVAMDDAVVSSWTGTEVTGPISVELVQVSVFLAAFSGLYFTVYAVTDELYRTQFFSSITRELERAVGARTVYQALRTGAPPGEAEERDGEAGPDVGRP